MQQKCGSVRTLQSSQNKALASPPLIDSLSATRYLQRRAQTQAKQPVPPQLAQMRRSGQSKHYLVEPIRQFSGGWLRDRRSGHSKHNLVELLKPADHSGSVELFDVPMK